MWGAVLGEKNVFVREMAVSQLYLLPLRPTQINTLTLMVLGAMMTGLLLSIHCRAGETAVG